MWVYIFVCVCVCVCVFVFEIQKGGRERETERDDSVITQARGLILKFSHGATDWRKTLWC